MNIQRLFEDNVQGLRFGQNYQASGHCPFPGHNDKNPSFSVNLDKNSEKYGLWTCHGGCGSGNAPLFAERLGHDPAPYKSYKKNNYDQIDIKNKALCLHDYLTTNFIELQEIGKIPSSWNLNTVKATLTGYDKTKDCITFIHCDSSSQPINIKYHKFGEGKETNQQGQSKAKLFPLNLIPAYDNDQIIVYCEGEKDCVTLLSQGINAVTGTTGAGSIPKDLTSISDKKKLIIAYDNDQEGIKSSQPLASKLRYEFPSIDLRISYWKDRPKHFDITDYFLEGNTKTDFYEILLQSEPFKIASGNWIKLYRKSINSVVFKNCALWHLWCFLIMRTSFKRDFVLWKTGRSNTTILVQPGQVVFGRNQWAKQLNIHPSTLWDRIKKLERMGNIEIQPNTHYSIITICNWDTYQ